MYMSSFNFMWLLPRCGYQLRLLPYNTCNTKADVFFCSIHRAIIKETITKTAAKFTIKSISTGLGKLPDDPNMTIK